MAGILSSHSIIGGQLNESAQTSNIGIYFEIREI